MDRRGFLKGLGGVVVALPFLEGLAPKGAKAAPGAQKFVVIMRQANGVQQAWDKEPERFWPTATGAISASTLSGRALGELSDYASKMLAVKGIKFNFPGNGCGHSGGGNQCLTAAQVSADPSGAKSLAMGESIDNRIMRELMPGTEPLTLYGGRMGGYLDEVLSYRGPKMLRAAERNPYNAYKRLFGLPDAGSIEAAKKQLMRKSVNDMVRSQMSSLLARTDLSKADRDRLELHRSAIRDTELGMVCKLPDDRIAEMEAMSPKVANPDYMVDIAKMQADIIALALSCGLTRAVTLQIGDGNDSTEYTIGGSRYPSYHQISHRIFSDGDMGAPIENAVDKHHEVDKLHGQMFKYLCDKLNAVDVGGGKKLLDMGAAIWTNDLGTGPPHSYENIPIVIVGGIDGALKQGQFVDVGKVTNNKLWNTIGAAVGCKNSAGSPMDDFGDPSLTKGNIPQMLA